ncbi:MAG: DUF11 domain-containing protein [Hyphomonadaceae bacterium]|nr:DUF11 domain-containing protein [Hyphomonadaceae bacterium]
MSFGRKHIIAAMWLLTYAWAVALLSALPAAADLGDRVTNVAQVSQSTEDGVLVFPTNEAAFTIEARRTPSEIEFFRIVENAPDAFPVTLNGSDYSPSGKPDGPFLPVGESPLLNTKTGQSFGGPQGSASDAPYGAAAASAESGPGITGKSLGPNSVVNIVSAQTYLAGELIVVRVIDLGQNGNADRIETVATTITTDNGDTITVRLYEDTPDSGHFYAFFPTTSSRTPVNDRILTAPQNTKLTATYIDIFDSTEVSIDTAAVDPFGQVFDSYTGELLDGIRVSIVDADTGLPAEIMGIDGGSRFPSTVQTGQPISDSNGITYPASEGVFFFPLLVPGRYRLVVETPPGYVYPSIRSEADLQGLSGAPYELRSDASFGQIFEVTSSGPVNIDVPIDPAGDLVVRKRAAEPQASVGDFIGYTVELENSGTVPAPFSLLDTLPEGLRYVAGTARVDKQAFADPAISPNGRDLTFSGGLVLPGTTIQLTYLAAVGPGTPQGAAINRAVAINAFGAALSNRAEAAVYIKEDLLSSRSTIVGRIAEAACSPDDAWARSILDGAGVGGVRIYMETGQYVVTDENGLFHFEGVKPGTHVVQVDEATLPEGYEPVICEENTRYAGSAFSKFVDAQGGSIWRANFYLRKTNAVTKAEQIEVARTRSEDIYDEEWLNTQTLNGLEWVYPAPAQTPYGRSVELGLKHGPDQRVHLELNGARVPGLNFSGRDLSVTRDVAISRWAGVDIQRGENTFVAILLDADGNELDRAERKVWFVDEVDRARLVDDQSVLVADGRTKPAIAIRLESGDGHAVHEGRIVEIAVADPYRLAQEAEEEFESPVDAGFSAVSGIRVGANGVAIVELEPTLESGRVRLQVQLEDGSLEDIDVWLAPEKRDWIVVGLAEIEGMASKLEDTNGRRVDELMSDGRLAFFAKGMVKGDWLLTVAVDTAKRRGAQDGEIFDRIDPNAYYTLYGDRTWQFNDAESRYPVYVKLEKNTFQAVFGDYETGFTETDLGRYSRRMSGLKADYESEALTVTAFAAETNQTFIKDEIAADGTSGPYRLRSAPLVRSSEVITIETRNRLRPDEIVSLTPLNRYIDYEIDYITGELFFRQPVAATDSGLNPNVIVVDYETSDQGDRGVTAGFRAASRIADGRIQAGITVLHEEDGSTREAAGSDLIATDLTVQISRNTELRAEYAESNSRLELGDASGEAMLLEATRRTEAVNITGYVREESAGFGLGQQASSTAAVRRIGAQLSAELGVQDTEDGSDRAVRRIEAQAYHERNLSQGADRSVADMVWQQDSQTLGVSAGLRAVNENFEDDVDRRQSILLLAGLRKTFVEQGLTISAVWEQPISSENKDEDEATLFPGRTVFGLDKALGKRATVNLRHEITDGENASGQNTVAGISWEPLGGTQVRAATDMITNESGRRIGATVGVDQVWQVDDAWTIGGGFARRANVDGEETPRDVAPDAAISPLADGVRSALTTSEQYRSGYFGVGYQAEGMAASGRVEVRDSTSGTRLVATLGGAREITKTLSFSGAARHQRENLQGQSDREETDLRIGAAWRPRGEGVIVLNRLDVGHLYEQGIQDRSKIVNNLAINAMLTKQTQVSFYHGVKRVKMDFEGASAAGTTHLLGAEVRHDLYKGVDVGVQTTWASSDASGTEAWSFGPSFGFSPQDNMWVSLGWNVSGFDDADFEAAKYRNEGPYIKLRAKFDQNTAKGLLKSMGLGAE